jgi:hypothetical protein
MCPEDERRQPGNGGSGIGALFPEPEMKRAKGLVMWPRIA